MGGEIQLLPEQQPFRQSGEEKEVEVFFPPCCFGNRMENRKVFSPLHLAECMLSTHPYLIQLPNTITRLHMIPHDYAHAPHNLHTTPPQSGSLSTASKLPFAQLSLTLLSDVFPLPTDQRFPPTSKSYVFTPEKSFITYRPLPCSPV